MADYRLNTEKLTIGYDKDLIKDISMSVKPGSIVTLIGPNGCGKSTFLKTITGQLSLRGGVIYLDGNDKSLMSATKIARQMSMVMTSSLKPELMTCREVIETGRYPYTGMMGILSEEDKNAVNKAMLSTDTDDIADRIFSDISDGQRQRVMLARAICQEPDILILDEPTSYLDVKYKLDILSRIKNLVKNENISVVMSLHELDIAMRISDSVIAMGEGKVLRYGPVEEVFEEDFIRRLYGIEEVDITMLGSELWFNGSDRGRGDDHHVNAKKDMIKNVPEPYKKSGAKVIMVQGTMSNAGKSILVGGLCRIFSQDGYRTAPFKSQNMALNSYITSEGLEMGRAQVMQAQCANIEPLVCMNPVLLKPTGDKTSQVIVNGKVVSNMKAGEYFEYKSSLKPQIMEAFNKLSQMVDIIVVEGAGSPVEMNLKDNDIVNMGLADMIDAPVLLVGDIDRGGVFAQLVGTMELLEEHEKLRIKGLVVNKFRGDKQLFDSGIKILEEKTKTKVMGVIPYIDIHIDDEDSLTERFYVNQTKTFDIAVIKLPHISNFTDFDVFEQFEDVSVRYVSQVSELCKPDMLIIPGTKTTVDDLKWLKGNGLADSIIELAKKDTVIFGICGGYQMLGRKIEDPAGTEGSKYENGLGLLNVDTVMEEEKIRTVFEGRVTDATGVLSSLNDMMVKGYEIHMGVTSAFDDINEFTSSKTGFCRNNIYGTYIHGFFDKKEILKGVIEAVSSKNKKNITTNYALDNDDFMQKQYDKLAEVLRENMDIKGIYRMIGIDED